MGQPPPRPLSGVFSPVAGAMSAHSAREQKEEPQNIVAPVEHEWRRCHEAGDRHEGDRCCQAHRHPDDQCQSARPTTTPTATSPLHHLKMESWAGRGPCDGTIDVGP